MIQKDIDHKRSRYLNIFFAEFETLLNIERCLQIPKDNTTIRLSHRCGGEKKKTAVELDLYIKREHQLGAKKVTKQEIKPKKDVEG